MKHINMLFTLCMFQSLHITLRKQTHTLGQQNGVKQQHEILHKNYFSNIQDDPKTEATFWLLPSLKFQKSICMFWVKQKPVQLASLSIHYMSMTDVPEIGTENPYRKTGTIKCHETRANPIHYHKLIPEKFGTTLHVRHVRNRYWFSGTGFWCRFVVSVSQALCWLRTIIIQINTDF